MDKMKKGRRKSYVKEKLLKKISFPKSRNGEMNIKPTNSTNPYSTIAQSLKSLILIKNKQIETNWNK